MDEKMNFLLSDELHIDEDDYLERQLLVQEFSKQPEEFFLKWGIFNHK